METGDALAVQADGAPFRQREEYAVAGQQGMPQEQARLVPGGDLGADIHQRAGRVPTEQHQGDRQPVEGGLQALAHRLGGVLLGGVIFQVLDGDCWSHRKYRSIYHKVHKVNTKGK